VLNTENVRQILITTKLAPILPSTNVSQCQTGQAMVKKSHPKIGGQFCHMFFCS